jgi:hypothetical protein
MSDRITFTGQLIDALEVGGYAVTQKTRNTRAERVRQANTVADIQMLFFPTRNVMNLSVSVSEFETIFIPEISPTFLRQ